MWRDSPTEAGGKIEALNAKLDILSFKLVMLKLPCQTQMEGGISGLGFRV